MTTAFDAQASAGLSTITYGVSVTEPSISIRSTDAEVLKVNEVEIERTMKLNSFQANFQENMMRDTSPEARRGRFKMAMR